MMAIRFLLILAALLPLTTATVFSSLLRQESNDEAELISRELRNDRTYRYYNTDLNCVVGQQRTGDALKFFPFEFWYAAEADTPDMNYLRTLELKLFKAVSSHVFWCYGQYSTTNYDGRRLSDSEIAQRELEIRLARRLGVVSVSSGGFDAATNNACPFASRYKYCTVVKGKMTIMAHANDDVRYVIASIQDALENAMYTNVVLDQRAMPTLRNVKYLGDSSEDAYAGAGATGGENNEAGVFVSSIFPSSTPSNRPTMSPTVSSAPSSSPSRSPTKAPSSTPTKSPAPSTSPSSSSAPSSAPSSSPSSSPSGVPTQTTMPSDSPSASTSPSAQPTVSPSSTPSAFPSESPAPSSSPSAAPSNSPSAAPSVIPSAAPSDSPSVSPSGTPSGSPSATPSSSPSSSPSAVPSRAPSASPSDSPSSSPSGSPSMSPSDSPSTTPSASPSTSPTANPSISPSESPSASPSGSPSDAPSTLPSSSPSASPSGSPSGSPSSSPSHSPTRSPSDSPSGSPSSSPTNSPSGSPSNSPSGPPSGSPTAFPSDIPSTGPTDSPSSSPSALPSSLPSSTPTAFPTDIPSTEPSLTPTASPSESPTTSPSKSPTISPSATPSGSPSDPPTPSPTDIPSQVPTDLDRNDHIVATTNAPHPNCPPQGGNGGQTVTEDGNGVVAIGAPTDMPTFYPTATPTASAPKSPSSTPSLSPTVAPTSSSTPSSHPSYIDENGNTVIGGVIIGGTGNGNDGGENGIVTDGNGNPSGNGGSNGAESGTNGGSDVSGGDGSGESDETDETVDEDSDGTGDVGDGSGTGDGDASGSGTDIEGDESGNDEPDSGTVSAGDVGDGSGTGDGDASGSGTDIEGDESGNDEPDSGTVSDGSASIGGGVVTDVITSAIPLSESVTYDVVFTNNWSETNHPPDYPSGVAVWSAPLIVSHNSTYTMWQADSMASAGVQLVAESGNASALLSELNAAGSAVGDHTIGTQQFNNIQQSQNLTISVSSSEQLVSAIGMIAPSPDWFAGFNNYTPNDGSVWHESFTIYSQPYDAGTDSGTTYLSNNSATDPQVDIFEITADTSPPPSMVFVRDGGVLHVSKWIFTLRVPGTDGSESDTGHGSGSDATPTCVPTISASPTISLAPTISPAPSYIDENGNTVVGGVIIGDGDSNENNAGDGSGIVIDGNGNPSGTGNGEGSESGVEGPGIGDTGTDLDGVTEVDGSSDATDGGHNSTGGGSGFGTVTDGTDLDGVTEVDGSSNTTDGGDNGTGDGSGSGTVTDGEGFGTSGSYGSDTSGGSGSGSDGSDGSSSGTNADDSDGSATDGDRSDGDESGDSNSTVIDDAGFNGTDSTGGSAGNGTDGANATGGSGGSGYGEGNSTSGDSGANATGESEFTNSTDGLNSTAWTNSTNSTNFTDDLEDGGFIVLPTVSGATREVEPQQQAETRTALAVSMPLIAALLIGLLLYKKQRRTMTASEYNEMMASDYVIVGTGDPPDSFHEGLYHYTKDGLRYLSTSCEACLETRRNTFYTDRGLPTIMENEVYDNDDDSEFIGVISPDSKDLGTRHLGIDVHKCTSAMCTRCNPRDDVGTVNFISSETNTSRAILRNQDFALTREEALAYRSYGSDTESGSAVSAGSTASEEGL